MRYRAFKDLAKAAASEADIPYECPLMLDWVAHIPVPKSWSKKKKAEHIGKPHQAKPDRDNIDKGVLDALFKEDSGIAGGTIIKKWCPEGEGRIEITCHYEDESN